jgi:hypothetical protein
MLRYEQRFNVAVSRARDRAVLVRSVRREELNPNDLKARLIAHFENPMPEIEGIEDALAICDSDFGAILWGACSNLAIGSRGKSARWAIGSIWSWKALTGGASLLNAMETAIMGLNNGAKTCGDNVSSRGLVGGFGAASRPASTEIPRA